MLIGLKIAIAFVVEVSAVALVLHAFLHLGASPAPRRHADEGDADQSIEAPEIPLHEAHIA